MKQTTTGRRGRGTNLGYVWGAPGPPPRAAALTRLPGRHVDGGAGGPGPGRIVRLDGQVVQCAALQVADFRRRLIPKRSYFSGVLLLVVVSPVFNLRTQREGPGTSRLAGTRPPSSGAVRVDTDARGGADSP